MATRNDVECQSSALARCTSEVDHCERALTPCIGTEAMRALAPMLGCLPIAKSMNEALLLDGFRVVVESYPLWAVKEAVAAFIAGRVEAHRSDFCPNTAVFGRELERRVGAMRERLRRARRMAEEEARLVAEGQGRKPRSSELQAAGDKRIAELRARANARHIGRGVLFEDRNGQAWSPGPELTAEELSDVPDAPRRRFDWATLGGKGFNPLPRPRE